MPKKTLIDEWAGIRHNLHVRVSSPRDYPIEHLYELLTVILL